MAANKHSNKHSNKPIVYFIEGNIGCGKSELEKQLNPDNYKIIDESMDLFTNFVISENKTINPLDLFYKNKISAFNFQILIFHIIFKQLLENYSTDKINIVTRSILSCIDCFGRVLHYEKKMSDEEFAIFQTLKLHFKLIENMFDIKFIYLKVKPEICYERMKQRNRKEEETCQFEYLQQLHIYYEKFIENLISQKYECFLIDAELSEDLVYENLLNIVNKN